MAYTLSSLRSGGNSTSKLLEAIKNTDKKFKKDPTYWELTVDKAGNGFATIRFLPAPFVDGEEGVPFSKPLFTHGFKGPSGQWYIENSLTTLGLQDPVGEYNSKLWATGIESNKNIARDQKRQLNFVSNILVIDDTAVPENNGKVFKYRYGKTIFDLIQERLPELKKEDVVYDPDFLFFNPFDPWEGANFKLKARIGTNKRRTYDKSTFVNPSPITKDEKELDKIWKASYSLIDVTDPKHFKSYADLKARLDIVLGLDGSSSGPVGAKSAEDDVAADVNEAVGESSSPFSNEDEEEKALFKRLGALANEE
jgi:hypothetical protein